jgi:transcriptional regulator with XRE-family HTH domain
MKTVLHSDDESSILKNMGARIKARREEMNMTQSDLAGSLGISEPYLSQIENVHRQPKVKIYMDICKILKVNMDYIFQGNIYHNKYDVNNITQLLNMCTNRDIKIVYDLIESLLRNK